MSEISLLESQINTIYSDVYILIWIFGIIFIVFFIGFLIAFSKLKKRRVKERPLI